MQSHTLLAALREVLAELYPAEADARVVVADAGLNERLITFSSRAQTNWQNILAEAIRCNRLDAMLAALPADYQQNLALQAVLTDYRQLLAAGGSLTVDDNASAPLSAETYIYGDEVHRNKIMGDQTNVGNISHSVVAVGSGATATSVVNIIEEAIYNVRDLVNPYLGLRSFSYSNRAIYAGRDASLREAMEKLTNVGKEQALLFITGASGSGKSSFVQAGLIPKLEKHYADNKKHLQFAIFRPYSQPMLGLCRALQEIDCQSDARNPGDEHTQRSN